MISIRKYLHFFISPLITVLFTGCVDDFLDVKYDKRSNVPVTVQDFQALLDQTSVFNQNLPTLWEVSADDFYLLEPRWQALGNVDRNAYIWSEELGVLDEHFRDWNEGFRRIYTANVVMEGLRAIDREPSVEAGWQQTYSMALFFRASSFFQLAQLFCRQYDERTAGADPGIPLRLEPDLDKAVPRSSVEETYMQIISDLNASLPFLPEKIDYKTRPSKASAYALLAKVYLQMGGYDRAKGYADSALHLYDRLLDYNAVNLEANFPFTEMNEEVLFHATMVSSSTLGQANLHVDTLLYAAYDENDLRKQAFFRRVGNVLTFKGSYTGSSMLFAGITSAEIHLIRAECLSRRGELNAALIELKTLLEKRFKAGTLVLDEVMPEEILERVLSERRKELVFRGIRWSDIRRLNLFDQKEILLVRQLGENVYELRPNSQGYTIPFPVRAVRLGGYEVEN